MRYLLIFSFLFCFSLSFAQQDNIDFANQNDNNEITEETKIEDKIPQLVQIENTPKKAVFASPISFNLTLPRPAEPQKDTLSQKDFEVISLKVDAQNPLEIKVEALPFNIGISTFTALRFTDKEGDIIETIPFEVEIEPVKTEKGDNLVDIRNLYKPFNWWLIIWIVLGLLVAFFIGRYFYFRKTKKKILKLTPYQEHLRPMHEIALEELNMLLTSDLWLNKEYKLFYTELGDIVRNFLSARFNFEADKLTSKELIKKLRNCKEFSFDNNILRDFLTSLTLVKFAKQDPNEEQKNKDIKITRDLILTNKELDLTRYQKIEKQEIKK